MPLYVGHLTVDAGTEATEPEEVKIRCAAGILFQHSITFRDGCNDLVRVSMYHGGHQIVPIGASEYLTGDGRTIQGRDWYELKASDNIITVKAWSPDTIYEHGIDVELWVLPEDVLAFGTLMSRVPDLVRKVLLGRKKKEEV